MHPTGGSLTDEADRPLGGDLGAEGARRVGLLAVALDRHVLGVVEAGVGAAVVLAVAVLAGGALVAADGAAWGRQQVARVRPAATREDGTLRIGIRAGLVSALWTEGTAALTSLKTGMGAVSRARQN